MNPNQNPNPILELADVVYSYPGTDNKALDRLSLALPAGRQIALCGHNGSGKSTFFLHAVGIHRPQSGTVRWKGAPVSYKRKELLELRRQVGLVFQDPEQQLILGTPYEDVSYGLRNAGVPEPEIRARTGAVLERMGLEDLAHTPIHHLSLGQKKRVTLAGVLVLEPSLLLLDEPTAYLDRASERLLLDELADIRRSGVTVVMATHDMDLAYTWADQVLVMDKGACLLQGPPAQVFAETETIGRIGLELPLLLRLWQSLPRELREGADPPRSADAFGELLAARLQAAASRS
ncbi:energy-coupling factor ABC transporter ATP-binding protein [Paenibacillus sp. UNC499MF]|uniref:energy-coupling factor ABC transporter ATP-binding protein n=1 Tax=Paenibacillus sp. UNC499MF TaxID=1502751 RepID=UPI00089F85D6|nr:ABC transporter ATP-binding protein [Paenibacillus sp. UNC499MF]SEG28693.1 cobalt/nickel transport system ATP-binding protein [Paenibacillus sp. UNC499MF]